MNWRECKKGDLFEAFGYIIDVRERYYIIFFLVCTFKKAIKNVEVKVDGQKGPLGFREKFDNKYVSSTQ